MRIARESNKDLGRKLTHGLGLTIRREYNFYSCPKRKRARGFSDLDSACSECHSVDECKRRCNSNTLKKLLNAMDDLNRKLLHDDPFEFYDGETSYWNLVKDPSCIDLELLDGLRQQIKTKIQDWEERQEERQEEHWEVQFWKRHPEVRQEELWEYQFWKSHPEVRQEELWEGQWEDIESEYRKLFLENWRKDDKGFNYETLRVLHEIWPEWVIKYYRTIYL